MKIYMNANNKKIQIFHFIKYDLKGQCGHIRYSGYLIFTFFRYLFCLKSDLSKLCMNANHDLRSYGQLLSLCF